MDWIKEQFAKAAGWAADNVFAEFWNWFVGFLKYCASEGWDLIYSGSDYMIILIMATLLIVMFGSKKGRDWLYWEFAIYIIIKVLGEVF